MSPAVDDWGNPVVASTQPTDDDGKWKDADHVSTTNGDNVNVSKHEDGLAMDEKCRK